MIDPSPPTDRPELVEGLRFLFGDQKEARTALRQAQGTRGFVGVKLDWLGRRSAQQGFTFSLRSAQQGFTLIELMVVITIIGLMSAAVIFNLPDPRGRLIDEAERFAARTLAVRDEAVTTARETRVRVTQGGYAFDQRQRGNWAAIMSKPLAATRWEAGTIGTPSDTIFDPTGLASEDQRITLKRDDISVSVTIGSDGSINVGK